MWSILFVTSWHKNYGYIVYIIVIPHINVIIIFAILFSPRKGTLSFLSYMGMFRTGYVRFQSVANSWSSDGHPFCEGKKQVRSLGNRDAKYPAAVSPTWVRKFLVKTHFRWGDGTPKGPLRKIGAKKEGEWARKLCACKKRVYLHFATSFNELYVIWERSANFSFRSWCSLRYLKHYFYISRAI